jgi:hypothetical protein
MVRLGNRAQFGSVYGGGKRVFGFDFSHAKSRYPFLLFISQAETERIRAKPPLAFFNATD